MQIYMSASTATTAARGAVLNATTTQYNVQTLPAWAPDIAYLPTTTLLGPDACAMVTIYGPTTVAGGRNMLQQCVIRAWDARHFALPMHIRDSAAQDSEPIPHEVYHAAKGDAVICLTYRAVGELSR